MFIGDMGIYLCSRNVTVAKHTLHASQIGAVHKEISGKTMSHCVRTDMFCDTGEASVFGDHTLD